MLRGTVDGVETSAAVSLFADATRVTLTQTGRFGTWLCAQHSAALPSSSLGDEDCSEDSAAAAEGTFTVEVLLGDRNDDAAVVIARKLCETVHALRRDDAPLLLTVALRDRRPSPAHVRALLDFARSTVADAFGQQQQQPAASK